MTHPAVGRIASISFITDMTLASPPVIPLAYMLEASWPEQARWLGLIGRTRLTEAELERVNKATWPELQMPFAMLNELFEQGWESAWGEAGMAVQQQWSRSSFSIDVGEYPLMAPLSAETADAWTHTCDSLSGLLNGFKAKLAPTIVPPPVRPMLRRLKPIAAKPIVTQPIRTLTQEAPEALAA